MKMSNFGTGQKIETRRVERSSENGADLELKKSISQISMTRLHAMHLTLLLHHLTTQLSLSSRCFNLIALKD